MQRRGIPGQSAPASLKQQRHNRIHPVHSRNTGAVCPGLIEAYDLPEYDQIHHFGNTGAVCPGLIEASKSRRWTCPLSGNTGAVCPGLIEARRSSAVAPRSAPGIPGQSAPASLKLEIREIADHLAGGNTGAVCPGLIEARRAP